MRAGSAFSGSAVGDLTAGDHQGNGATLAVSQGMDLGGASAARAPDRLITLPPLPPEAQRCALTAELSMRTCAGGPSLPLYATRLAQPYAMHAFRTASNLQRLSKCNKLQCL